MMTPSGRVETEENLKKLISEMRTPEIQAAADFFGKRRDLELAEKTLKDAEARHADARYRLDQAKNEYEKARAAMQTTFGLGSDLIANAVEALKGP